MKLNVSIEFRITEYLVKWIDDFVHANKLKKKIFNRRNEPDVLFRQLNALCSVHFEEVVIESKKDVGVQTEQTPTEYCLASTNAQLVQELIVKDNLIQERDQKYIEMLERFFVEKTHLTEENKEQKMEIVRLNARITEMENMPLIPIDDIGEFSMR